MQRNAILYTKLQLDQEHGENIPVEGSISIPIDMRSSGEQSVQNKCCARRLFGQTVFKTLLI